MSMQTSVGVVPEFDRADRMRKALRVSGISVQEIADYLGVARNTVSTWINGRIDPSTQTVRLWALRTGVPYEWLQTGEIPDQGPGGGLPRLDSNQ
jgi:transcriptional regulator with XRE-family HTH domain